MKHIIKLIYWRLTGYRKLSKLLHAHFGEYDALTPVGLEEAEILQREESRLLRSDKPKKYRWFERFLFNYL